MAAVIQAIHFPRGFGRDGLRHEVSLANLSRIVVLTGPNGSGKTRLLHRIQTALADSASGPAGAVDAAAGLPRLQFAEGADPAGVRIVKLDGTVAWTKALGDYSASELQLIVNNLEQGLDTLPRLLADGLAILQSVTINHLVTSHPAVAEATKSPSARVGAWFTRLKAALENDASASINVDGSGVPHLYGRDISDLRESDGQRKLIQYAVGLASIRKGTGGQSPVVVFLDEPELHLHPGALIGFMDRLLAAMPLAQFFIATHSLPLLAHLGFHNTWFAVEGDFRSAAAAPESALLSLFGGNENIGKLRAALDEPAHRAISQFAAESLLAPDSVHYREGDPQCAQIIAALRKRRGTAQRIRVLDFGAGRGRLAAALSAESPDLTRAIDYHAYDPDPAASGDCAAAIALLYPSDETVRHHSTPAEIADRGLNGSFDVVVLCNVLHEVHPKGWESVIRDLIVDKLLAEDGILLVLEDLWMSHGEKAYDEGFLLLDPQGIETLFATPSGSELAYTFLDDQRYSDRLVAYAICRSALGRMNGRTIRDTLEYTIEKSKDDIRSLRQEPATNRNARRHAKSVMQLSNAFLLLEGFRAEGGESAE